MLSEHECGIAIPGQGRVGVRACLEKFPDHGRLAVYAGEQQGSGAIAIGGGDVGPGTDEQIGHIQVVGLDRPMQRGGSIHLRRVDIGLPFQK